MTLFVFKAHSPPTTAAGDAPSFFSFYIEGKDLGLVSYSCRRALAAPPPPPDGPGYPLWTFEVEHPIHTEGLFVDAGESGTVVSVHKTSDGDGDSEDSGHETFGIIVLALLFGGAMRYKARAKQKAAEAEDRLRGTKAGVGIQEGKKSKRRKCSDAESGRRKGCATAKGKKSSSAAGSSDAMSSDGEGADGKASGKRSRKQYGKLLEPEPPSSDDDGGNSTDEGSGSDEDEEEARGKVPVPKDTWSVMVDVAGDEFELEVSKKKVSSPATLKEAIAREALKTLGKKRTPRQWREGDSAPLMTVTFFDEAEEEVVLVSSKIEFRAVLAANDLVAIPASASAKGKQKSRT